MNRPDIGLKMVKKSAAVATDLGIYDDYTVENLKRSGRHPFRGKP